MEIGENGKDTLSRFSETFYGIKEKEKLREKVLDSKIDLCLLDQENNPEIPIEKIILGAYRDAKQFQIE